MILAVTIWNESISPVFEVSQTLVLFEVKDGLVTQKETIAVPSTNSFDKVKVLIELGVDTLICGALTRPIEKMILNQGLELHPFISGKLNEVITAWQENSLIPTFKMPGCRRRRYGDDQKHCCPKNGRRANFKNKN